MKTRLSIFVVFLMNIALLISLMSGGDQVTAAGLTMALQSASVMFNEETTDSVDYMVRQASSTWHIETVGSGGIASSLALDTAGNPHISSYSSSSLKYAYWDGSTWHIETVDSIGDMDLRYTSLALDGAGSPHISYSYMDWPNGTLKYARYDGLNWHIETVDSGKLVGWANISLALDTAGNPHMSYHHGGTHTSPYNLNYAYQDATGWHIQAVDRVGAVGTSSSLALDAAGHPHISYEDWSNNTLKYAHWDGSDWHKEIVVGGDVGHTSIALDRAGNPHISYWDVYPTYDLKYAYWDGSTWHIETVDSGDVDLYYYTSLALDTAGNPHISYYGYESGAYGLKYACWDGSDWHIETVDSGGTHYISLALDRTGNPHISYYKGTLKYARKTGGPGPDPNLELAQRFAPYMYFHQHDIYRPISVTVPVEKAPRLYDGEVPPDTLPTLDDLASLPWRDRENAYIDLKGDGKEELHNVYLSEISPQVEPLVLTQVDSTSTPGKIAIQYWLFYYDNPWRDHHEGDWEMVQVVLDSNEAPLYVVYSQHLRGSKRWWSDIERVGEHPVVYVAQGSHASYFKPYDYFQGVEPLGGIDETAPAKREGVVSVQLLPASLTQDTWLYFKGHWGDRGKGAQWFYFDEDGPRGPSQKKGEKWDNPVAWSESLPWDEEAHHNLVRKLCASVLAPLDVHLYELPSQAHVGWKEGKLELGIADAEYFDNPAGWRTILLHEVNPEFEYKVELGYRAATYQMGTQVASEEIIVALSFPDVEASTVIVALYSLTGTYGVSTTATISVYHGSDFNMRIDIDGDETIDEEVAPIAMEEIPTDFTAPSVITDLEVLTSTIGSVVLSWTAPGDDGDIGTAAAYDLRYYATPITESNWVSATQVISPPIPSLAGITDVFTVTGIPGGVYYFALKARDDLLQSSGLSNVVETEVPYGLYLPVVLRNH